MPGPWHEQRVLSGTLFATASSLDVSLRAPEALTVGQVSKLAGDLLAFRLVVSADLAYSSAGAVADLRTPRPERLLGDRRRRRFGVKDVVRILLEQRIDGAAGAEIAGLGRSWPAGQDVNLVAGEKALCSR